MPNTASEGRSAVLAGAACYLIWGFVPLVFQLIGHMGADAWEILAHRVIWGTLAAAVFVAVAHQWRELGQVLRAPKTLLMLLASATLIAVNWVIFIWAVNNGRTLETALGYYITPLINMAAGALLFRERTTGFGIIAMGFAVVGVVLQTLALGHLPLVAIALSLSFGGYGIIRKRVHAEAQTGLLVECLVLLLPSLAYVLWLENSGAGHFLSNPVEAAWLVAAGPITATPLVLFAWAARRMPLSAMGFLQFLAPTISFFIGASEGEPFTPMRAASFVFIWAGALIFAGGAWLNARKASKAAARAEACGVA
jgi:chloramphenicol-sensitive protein RarD